MEPALPNGSYIIADTKAYQQRAPQRGDIVAFHLQDSPSSNSTQLFVKRVIGLPGEIVTTDQGQVSIDGVPLNEPYIINPGSYNGEWHMVKDQYFVLGDNRGDSKDSHNWGGLPRENILAKVIWIYWPLDNFGEIPDVSSEY
jgi:signal peptidase I